MNDSIQILNKNGDMMSVEGIANIVISETNKKYLFYTLNEKVDNDLTKIYIAEESDVQGGANPINDTEWDDIRKKMVKISHKEELTDISYLPFGDGTINVGEAKKLAVTAVAKQAFKEAQAMHTISTNQSATPVVGETPSFFASPAEEDANQQAESTASEANIFNNPPTPVPTENQNVDAAPVAVEPAQTPGTPAVEAPTQEPTQAVVAEQPAITPEASANEVIQPVVEQPIETPAVESVPANTTNEQKEIISDEDALKAIEVIQDYIAQEEAA